MYKFEDTPKRRYSENAFIPTSAMYYDGILFEQKIEGYQTLSVEGREMYSLSFATQEKAIGSEITQMKFPARQLTIKYKLEDNDPDELQRKFDKLLTSLIREEDVEIRFNDDLQHSFFGRFISADTVPGNSNSVISSFSIYCSAPFKYSALLTSNGIVASELPFAVKPEKFIATMTAAGSLKITDGDFYLSASSRTFNVGDTIEFNFKNGFVYVNGIFTNNVLDLDSDFKNIRLYQGSNFTGNNYELKILYRKKVL